MDNISIQIILKNDDDGDDDVHQIQKHFNTNPNKIIFNKSIKVHFHYQQKEKIVATMVDVSVQ